MLQGIVINTFCSTMNSFWSPQQSFPLLYLEIISIIFFPQKYEFFLFYFSVSSSLSRLTKRKNELNLIANRDATTQLLCQYAKNTQTFNSRGCWMEFFFGVLEILSPFLSERKKRTFYTRKLTVSPTEWNFLMRFFI